MDEPEPESDEVEVANSNEDAIYRMVQKHGGSISMKNLEDVYRSRYSINLPYFESGYSNPQEFLTALGFKVDLVDDEYRVSTVASIKSHQLIDSEVDPLCVSVSNSLILGYGSNYDRRKVSIQSERTKRTNYRKKLVRKSFLPATFDEFIRKRNSSPESLYENSGVGGRAYCSSIYSIDDYDSGHDTSLFSINSDPYPYDNEYHSNDYSVRSENNNYDDYAESKPEALDDFLPKLDTNVDNVPDIMRGFGGHSYANPAAPDFVEDTDIIPDLSNYRLDRNKVTDRDTIPDLLNYCFKSESDVTVPKLFNNALDSSRVPSVIKSRMRSINPDTKYQRRLEQIVDAQKRSISTDEIETLYYQCYPELLPKNWLQTLRRSNKFYIENLEKVTLVYPSVELNSTPTVTSLPQLDYPEHAPWKIHVTVVSSTTSIWFRICELDFNFRFENLRDELQKHYESPDTKTAKILKCDELYAARYENEMFRVQVMEGQHEWVKCFLIDVGSVKLFKIDQLIPLHKKFTNIPALAVQGALTDLEQYNTCEYVSSKLQTRIEGENGSAVVNYIHKNNKVFFNFFMSGDAQRVNINNIVLEEIRKELTVPQLEMGQTYQARILWVDREKARVQIRSPCLDLLEKSLAKAGEIIEAAGDDLYLKSMHDLSLNNENYLAKYKNSWQRVSLKQIFDSTRVAALFIDLGEIEMLNFASIVKPIYPRFLDTLAVIPAQAIELNVAIGDPITFSILQHSKKTEIGIFYGCMRIIETKPLYAQIFADLSKYPYEYASYV